MENTPRARGLSLVCLLEGVAIMEMLFLHAAFMLVGVVSVWIAIDWIVSCIREDGASDGWTTYKGGRR